MTELGIEFSWQMMSMMRGWRRGDRYPYRVAIMTHVVEQGWTWPVWGNVPVVRLRSGVGMDLDRGTGREPD